MRQAVMAIFNDFKFNAYWTETIFSLQSCANLQEETEWTSNAKLALLCKLPGIYRYVDIVLFIVVTHLHKRFMQRFIDYLLTVF